jgi:hypothetical protein
MNKRCHDPNAVSYKHYGAKGISVCSRWKKKKDKPKRGAWHQEFINFINDMGEKPTSKHSLDRINFEGNYEPSNCRWVTSTTQHKNKSRNVPPPTERGELNGRARLREQEVIQIREDRNKKMSLSKLSKKYGVSRSTISHIISRRTWNHI